MRHKPLPSERTHLRAGSGWKLPPGSTIPQLHKRYHVTRIGETARHKCLTATRTVATLRRFLCVCVCVCVCVCARRSKGASKGAREGLCLDRYVECLSSCPPPPPPSPPSTPSLPPPPFPRAHVHVSARPCALPPARSRIHFSALFTLAPERYLLDLHPGVASTGGGGGGFVHRGLRYTLARART